MKASTLQTSTAGLPPTLSNFSRFFSSDFDETSVYRMSRFFLEKLSKMAPATEPGLLKAELGFGQVRNRHGHPVPGSSGILNPKPSPWTLNPTTQTLNQP